MMEVGGLFFDFEPFRDVPRRPVELKHHAAGYLWIEPNHHVTHSAAQGHEFALRDRESKERLAVSVHALGRDEL